MSRKMISAALIVISLFALLIPASMAETRTMYVNTANGWYTVRFRNGTGYVMAKFLTANRISDEAIQRKEIERQLNNYRTVSQFTIVARPTNPATGWVNFRTNPGMGAPSIVNLTDGRMLTVIGETLDWYKAIDSVTGQVGFVMKAYVARV